MAKNPYEDIMKNQHIYAQTKEGVTNWKAMMNKINEINSGYKGEKLANQNDGTGDVLTGKAPEGQYGLLNTGNAGEGTGATQNGEDGFSPYEGSYSDQLADILDRIANSEYGGYDPSQDEALQQAVGSGTQNIMEIMNSKGLLKSTMTGDQANLLYGELMPQYAQMDYGRYMDELDRQYDLAGIYNQLNQQEYGQYSDYLQRIFQEKQQMALEAYRQAQLDLEQEKLNMTAEQYEWERDYTERTFEYQKSLDEIEIERQKIMDAMDRLEMLGYADDETAEILGIEPGTPSQRAREIAEQTAADIEKMQAQIQAEKDLMDYEYNLKKEETARQKEMEGKFNRYITSLTNMYLNQGENVFNTQLDAYKYNPQAKQQVIQDIGEENYDMLIATLESIPTNIQEQANETTKSYQNAFGNVTKMLGDLLSVDVFNEAGMPVEEKHEWRYAMQEIVAYIMNAPGLSEQERAELIDYVDTYRYTSDNTGNNAVNGSSNASGSSTINNNFNGANANGDGQVINDIDPKTNKEKEKADWSWRDKWMWVR